MELDYGVLLELANAAPPEVAAIFGRGSRDSTPLSNRNDSRVEATPLACPDDTSNGAAVAPRNVAVTPRTSNTTGEDELVKERRSALREVGVCGWMLNELVQAPIAPAEICADFAALVADPGVRDPTAVLVRNYSRRFGLGVKGKQHIGSDVLRIRSAVERRKRRPRPNAIGTELGDHPAAEDA